MRRFLAIVAVLGIIESSGAHWAALQGVAWARMAADRASETSWSQAIRNAISGKRPCSMCHMVERGEREQRNVEAAQPPRFEPGVLPLAGAAFIPVTRSAHDRSVRRAPPSIIPSPDERPPRTLA